MKNKKLFGVYTTLWMCALFLMLLMLWQISGYARAINYAGIVRGGTQKLSKQELSGVENDALIETLDGVIYDLQTGEGDYGIITIHAQEFQTQLLVLEDTWDELKSAIYDLRTGTGTQQAVYEISELHFEQADAMVSLLEERAVYEMIVFFHFFGVGFVVSISALIFYYLKNKKVLREIQIKDGLTGLLSRAGFEEAAVRYMRQEKERDLVLIKFDIDGFKLFNNTYGFQNGDEMLVCLSQALCGWAPQGSLCARIDADQFVLLAPQAEGMIADLEYMLQKAAHKAKVATYFAGIKFTFGAYQLTSKVEQIKAVLDKATEAHENAKQDAAQRVVWYNDALLEKLARENMLIQRMRKAIDEKEFKLYLQPQISLRTMRVVSAEALVRWNMPEGELLYPVAFIPLLENKGLISELDFYMLEQACAYLKENLAQLDEHFTIAVNFSRVSLYKPTFYQDFLETLMRYDLPCHRFEIEVLESTLSEVDGDVIELLQKLKDAGVWIAMDDFGAGYSNFNALSYLPVHIVKLDKQFLLEREKNDKMKHIMQCTVELAHVLSLRVICEGVENEQDVAFLRALGCEYAQGYLFAKPCAAQVFLKTCETMQAKYLSSAPL